MPSGRQSLGHQSRNLLCAEKLAGTWDFKWKLQRRSNWTQGLSPTRARWEHVLDSLKRRYCRRGGVSEEDAAQVERILKDWRGGRDEEK